MLYSHIKNSYQDSINLMLLTNEVNEVEGVKRGQVMMATDSEQGYDENSWLIYRRSRNSWSQSNGYRYRSR